MSRETKERLHLVAALLTVVVALVAADRLWVGSKRYAAAASTSAFLRRPINLLKMTGRLDVVVFGSSRPRAAVSPVALWDAGLDLCGQPIVAFNAGLPAGYGRATLAMVNQLLRRKGAKPKLALVYELPRAASSHLGELAEGMRGNAVVGRSYPLRAVPSLVRARQSWSDIATTVVTGPSALLQTRRQVLELVDGKRLGPTKFDFPSYRGWMPLRVVGASVQRSRMLAKMSFERAFYDPHRAHVDDLELDALDEAVRLLRGAGIEVVLLDAPAPREVSALDDQTVIGRAYRHELRAIARRWGASFRDDSNPAVMQDADYNDEHHMSFAGAAKYTRYLAETVIAPRLRCHAPTAPLCRDVWPADDPGWTIEGAFRRGQGPTGGLFWVVPRSPRDLLLSGESRRPAAVGRADSPPITLDRPVLVVYAGGTGQRTRVEVLVDGRVVAHASVSGSTIVHPAVMRVKRWMGQTAHLRLADDDPRGFLAYEGARACASFDTGASRR